MINFPNSAEIARKNGFSRYFTGLPCKHGHVCERITSNRSCAICLYLKDKKRKKTEAFREKERLRYRSNPEQKFINWKKDGVFPEKPETELCECCGKKPKGTINLDHDHVTGKFRGWLCWNCNTGIGKLGDSLDGVMKAVRYLESVQPRQSSGT